MPGGFTKIDNDVMVAIMTRVGASAYLVYSVLLMHADQDGKCYPSLGRIIEKTGLSKNIVIKSLRSLRTARAIEYAESTGRVTHYKMAEPVQFLNQFSIRTCSENEQEPVQKMNRTCSESEPLPVQILNTNKTHRTIPIEQHSPPTPSIETEPLTARDFGGREEEGEPSEFTRFCNAYPVIENRLAALREWKKLRAGPEMIIEIANGLRRWKNSGRDVDYFPDAANFIRDRRWKDTPRKRKDPEKGPEPPPVVYTRAPPGWSLEGRKP